MTDYKQYVTKCSEMIPGTGLLAVKIERLVKLEEAVKGYYKAIALVGHALDPVVCEARRHLIACYVSVDGEDSLLKEIKCSPTTH